MIRKPYIGMKVRIISVEKASGRSGGTCNYSFDLSLGDTGTITVIQRVLKGNSPKFYHVKLDPPNFGTMEFYGTQEIEPWKEKQNNDKQAEFTREQRG